MASDSTAVLRLQFGVAAEEIGASGKRGKAKTAHGRHADLSSDSGDLESTHSKVSDSSNDSEDSLKLHVLEDYIEVMRVTSTIEGLKFLAVIDTLAEYPHVRIWYFPCRCLAELIIGMINAKDNIFISPK